MLGWKDILGLRIFKKLHFKYGAVITAENRDGFEASINPTMLIGRGAPSSVATAGAGTITAAQMLSGIYVRDCAGASRTDTTDTAANLVSAIGPGAKVGDVINLLVINGSDPTTEILTLAAGAGATFDANQTAVSRTVLGTSSKNVKFRLTNVTAGAEAYVIYS